MLFLAQAYGGLHQSKPASSVPVSPLPLHALRYGELVADGPLYLLWPCLVPWLLFEADMGYAWLHHLPGISSVANNAAPIIIYLHVTPTCENCSSSWLLV